VVRLALRPPCFQYPKDKKVCGSEYVSGRSVEERDILLLSGIQTFISRAPTPSLVFMTFFHRFLKINRNEFDVV
jgi:hypothetical protein